jgi:hypothetical protein
MTEAFLAPAHTFDGDDQVSPEQYTAFVAHCRGVETIVPLAMGVAERAGLSVDGQTEEAWKRTLLTMNVLDTLLDDSEDRDGAYELYKQELAQLEGTGDMPELPEWASPHHKTAVILFGTATRELPEAQKTNILDCAKRIGEISVEKSRASDPKAYSAILEEEGTITGTLTANTVPAAVYEQPNYELFQRWTEHCMAVGTLLDSALDLPADYKRGLTQVAPTKRNQITLARRSLSLARGIVWPPQLGRATVQSLRDLHR